LVVALVTAMSAASGVSVLICSRASRALGCMRWARRPNRRLRGVPSGCGSLSPRLNTIPMYLRFVCFFGSR
jgi:hypothetical protein